MEYIDRKKQQQSRIQRQREQEHWEEAHNQLIEVQQKERVQKKSLEISQPGDSDEKEADEVARKVINGQSAEVHGGGGSVNRKGEGSTEATPEFHSKLNASKGGGQSLEDSTRSEMESKMGADFSNVKVHTGGEANQMSESINAKAFTHGQDIYFKDGQHNTSSNEGKELLAHELVHTVQQGGNVQAKIQRQNIVSTSTIELPEELKEAIAFNKIQIYVPSFADCLKELYYLNGDAQLYSLTVASKRNDREFAWMVQDGQRYLKKYYSKTKDNAKYDESTVSTIQQWAESRSAWNKKEPFSTELIDKLGKKINDPTGVLLLRAKAAANTESKYFAYLVLAAQRAMFTETTQHDGKFGSSTRKALDAEPTPTFIWDPGLPTPGNWQYNATYTPQGQLIVPVFVPDFDIKPIHVATFTWSGDPFLLELYNAGPDFELLITYAGNESADVLETRLIFDAPKVKTTQPLNIFTRSITTTTEYGTDNLLYVDLYSDGRATYLISDNVMLNQNWAPPGRLHQFSGALEGQSSIQDVTVSIRSKSAMPSKSAAKKYEYIPEKTPVITSDPILDNAADALSRAKNNIDGVLASPLVYGVLPNNTYWWTLQKNVNAAYNTATAKDARNDQSMLRSASALTRMVDYVKPKLLSVGPFMDENFHPAEVAKEAVVLAANVHNAFDQAVSDSFYDLKKANVELASANSQLQAMYFQMTTLYLDANRGMEQEVNGLNETIFALKEFRAMAHAGGNFMNIDYILFYNPSGLAPISVERFRFDLKSLRGRHEKADPKVFMDLMELYAQVKYYRQIASMMLVYEMFRYYNYAATNGLIAKGVDLLWPGNAGDKSLWYIGKLGGELAKLDTYYGKLILGQPITPDDSKTDKNALSVFYEVVSSPDYVIDIDFIKQRLETIASVRAIVQRIAIMVLAAAAAAVAGPVGGAIAAELGASATVVGIVEFAANVLVFTTVDVAGRSAILGEQGISFVGELGTNFLFFGLLRGVSYLNKLAFTKFIADPKTYKGWFAVTNTTATMIELHGLSMLQYAIAGKEMKMEQHLLAAFQNFTMLASVHLGSMLVEPISMRWNAKTREILLENFKEKVDILEKNRETLLKQIEVYDATKNKTPEQNAELLESITKQFNSEMELLTEGKKAGKENAGEVEKVIASHEQRLAAFQLELAQRGFDIPLGNKQFFRFVEPGLVSYGEGIDVEKMLDEYYKDKENASWSEDPNNPGVYHGKAGLETTTFVPESRVNDYAKSTGYKVIPLIVEEAKGNTKTPEEAVKYVGDKLTNQDARDMFDLLNEKQTNKQQFLNDLAQRERNSVANETSLERSLAKEAETSAELFAKRTGAKEAPGEKNTFTYNGDSKSLEYIKKYHKGKTVTGPDTDGTITVTGKNTEPFKYITEQRFKEIQLENKFGKTEAVKVKPDVFKLPADAFYRLIPQCRNINDVNRLYDVIEKRNPGSLKDVQKVEFPSDNYLIADGRTYIDNAEHITNADLISKVKDNPVQSAAIDKILSEIADLNLREQLQKDIAMLTDGARQLYIDIQGRMNVSQAELVKRAEIGDKNGYTAEETVDYFVSIDLKAAIDTNTDFADVLDVKGKKGDPRYQELIEERQKLEQDLLKQDKSKFKEVRKRYEELSRKLEMAVKEMEIIRKIEKYAVDNKIKFKVPPQGATVGKGYIIITRLSTQTTIRQDFISISGKEKHNDVYQKALDPEFVTPMPNERVFHYTDAKNKNDAEIKASEYAMGMIENQFNVKIEHVKGNGEPTQVYSDFKVEIHFSSLSQAPCQSCSGIKTQGQKVFGESNFIFDFNAIVSHLHKGGDIHTHD